MKKIITFILIVFTCLFGVSCVIETPEQHFKSPKEGEPTGTFASVSVSCETVLDNLTKVDSALLSFIPDNGIILKVREVEIMKKDTALKLLTDTLKGTQIFYVASSTYVYSVNHLGEKTLGDESGWVFYVNGRFSHIGAASYVVKENDVIEWRYSCVKGDLPLVLYGDE